MLSGLQSITEGCASVRAHPFAELLANRERARTTLGDVPRELDPNRFLNRSPDSFSPSEWRSVHGLWAAFELYSPQTTPLRRIQALGASSSECMEDIAARGLAASNFEYVPLRSPLPL